jgi:hypothetical protein
VTDYLYRPQGSTGVKANRVDDYVSGVPFSAVTTAFGSMWSVGARTNCDIVAPQRFQRAAVVWQRALAARRVVGKNPNVVSSEGHNTSMRLHRSLSRRRWAIAVGTNSVAYAEAGTAPPTLSTAAWTSPPPWPLAAPPLPVPASLLPAMATSRSPLAACSTRRLPAPTSWSTSFSNHDRSSGGAAGNRTHYRYRANLRKRRI